MVLSQGYVNFFVLCYIIRGNQKHLDADCLNWNSILNRFLLEQDEHKVISMLEVLVKHAYSREWEIKTHEDSRACNVSELFRRPAICEMLGHLLQIKNTLLNPTPVLRRIALYYAL